MTSNENVRVVDPAFQNRRGQEDLAENGEGSISTRERSAETDLAISSMKAGSGAVLAWENLTYSVEVSELDPKTGTKVVRERKILDNISGIVQPGEVLFIMGPTGAGKTTLLDALAERLGSGVLTGSLHVNGKEPDDKFKRIAAFVPQFEALTPSLTVRETFYDSVVFNHGASKNHKQRVEIVDEALRDLGLGEVADKKIGGALIKGITEGQKKRAAIGVEYVSGSQLLFLDEPTTGLDAASALSVMNRILDLARVHHKTVVCTIHQPSFELYEKFDKLMLLSRGKVAYFGSAGEAVREFFMLADHPIPLKTNPADHFLEVLNTDFSSAGDVDHILETYESSEFRQNCKNRLEYWHDLFHDKESDISHHRLIQVHQSFASTWLLQFWTLLKRNLVDIIRNPANFWARFFLYLALAIMMGTIFLNLSETTDSIQGRVSILFFVAAFEAFMTIAGLPVFLEEREVFQRERQNGYYRVSAYVVANSVAAIPMTIAFALAGAIPIYFMSKLNSGADNFGIFLAILFFCLYAAESMVVMVSALIPIFMIALALAAGSFGMAMLVGGFFVLAENLPSYLAWARFISFQFYSFRAFVYNEFQGQSFQIPGTTSSLPGSTILNRFSVTSDTRGIDCLILLVFALVFRLGFYTILRLRSGKK